MAAIVQRQDGRVLLAQRTKDPGMGQWAFPGGRLEWGESLFAGAERELGEETGLSARAEELLYIGEVRREAFHYVLIDVLMGPAHGLERPASDVKDLRWVGPLEWQDLALAEGMARCFSDPNVLRRLGWTS